MNTSGAIQADVYLKPGEIYISDKPAVVKTVLGSCISVTMFNARLRIGAICHGLLPECNEMNGCNCACIEGFRYVDCSIRRMLEELHSLGIVNDEIEIKMFGGADMFKTIGDKTRAINVGEKNIRTALKVLGESNLRLAASDTGGSKGRQIVFIPNTGEVFVKRLRINEMETPA
jgi:chemotaxis protein CheD